MYCSVLYYIILHCTVQNTLLFWCLFVNTILILFQESVISCIGSVDHSRYLLGDSRGRLLMLFLDFQEAMDTGVTSLTGMRLEVLGDVSYISLADTYLDI